MCGKPWYSILVLWIVSLKAEQYTVQLSGGNFALWVLTHNTQDPRRYFGLKTVTSLSSSLTDKLTVLVVRRYLRRVNTSQGWRLLVESLLN